MIPEVKPTKSRLGNWTFQWSDNNGTHRMIYSGYEDKGWYLALKKAGWDNRCSICIIGTIKSLHIFNGPVKNWWEAMNDQSLSNFNRLYLSTNLDDCLSSGFVKIVEVE